MRRASSFFVRWNRQAGTLASAALLAFAADAVAQDAGPSIDRIAALQSASAQNPARSHPFNLEGTMLWVDAARGRCVLQDASGAAQLELDLDASVQPGDRVRVEGTATVLRRGDAFRIGAPGPVVDNNGVHSSTEKFGSVHLSAGLQPITVDWFNGVEKSDLELHWQGPGIPRSRIPPSALFRQTPADTGNPAFNGLTYTAYEGQWEALPDVEGLVPIATGAADNFDLTVAPRSEHVSLRFTGFLNVPREGLYTFYLKSDDGSRLYVGRPTITLTRMGTTQLPAPRRILPGQIIEGHALQRAQTEGTVIFAAATGSGLLLEIESGGGRMGVEVTDPAGLNIHKLANCRVAATGVCVPVLTADAQTAAGVLLVARGNDIRILSRPVAALDAAANAAGLPTLSSAVEVHRLKRDEAARRYPVRLSGVVTSVLPEHQSFTLQDATRGIYITDLSSSRPVPPEPGEFLEVDGATDPGLFAPVVNASRVRSIARGHRPEPTRPTWNQLVNGSMDAQYVEILGVVTDTQTNRLTLRTEGGIIQVELRLAGIANPNLPAYENALIRIRGGLFASWDYVTHQVKPGEVRIYDAAIAVEQPAPADLFLTPAKAVPELRLFDPQASQFQRVKVVGQLLLTRGNESFLMQGPHGFRLLTRAPLPMEPGDLVEAVGFPDLFGPSAPVLREGLVRKTGQSTLPAPRRLMADELLRADFDATLVAVEGTLIAIRRAGSDSILELQNGIRHFAARLPGPKAFPESLALGSRLELTGIYAASSGDWARNPGAGPFELLLENPGNVRVLARPAWWTLERLLVTVGALALGLSFTVLWITQLRRKVEARTRELGQQIQERQRVEHQREMEQERSRIARDLHDELGSGITEIGMLAARARSTAAAEDQRNRHLEQMRTKAREMVTALDEIVWAMNPKHDSLSSLISYFSLYADRFLGLANISWQFENAPEPADEAVNSRVRHQAFLVFKEALTNIVRHSGATEVRLNLRMQGGQLQLTITDNGKGLPDPLPSEEMDGVANMRERIQRLGGDFEISSAPDRGTRLTFSVPIRQREQT